jgi:hypothetical protein
MFLDVVYGKFFQGQEFPEEKNTWLKYSTGFIVL